jgi:hypothetical protein
VDAKALKMLGALILGVHIVLRMTDALRMKIACALCLWIAGALCLGDYGALRMGSTLFLLDGYQVMHLESIDLRSIFLN